MSRLRAVRICFAGKLSADSLVLDPCDPEAAGGAVVDGTGVAAADGKGVAASDEEAVGAPVTAEPGATSEFCAARTSFSAKTC